MLLLGHAMQQRVKVIKIYGTYFIPNSYSTSLFEGLIPMNVPNYRVVTFSYFLFEYALSLLDLECNWNFMFGLFKRLQK